MFGSDHNDPFQMKEAGRLGTSTNHSGGVQGGISNGEPLVFGLLLNLLQRLDRRSKQLHLMASHIVGGEGRHDPCVVPRAVPLLRR